jgi:ABC-type Na+ efflux pump permease subunit
MATALFMLGLIALVALTIALLDWFGRRKERQSAHRP